MREIGFSTGALARGDFISALETIRRHRLTAVELSALREHEMGPLLDKLAQIDLDGFKYVALHLPSAYDGHNEERVIAELAEKVPKEVCLILHPDAAVRLERWSCLGDQLLIENMDKRKPTGRFVSELEKIFQALPEAGLCFDIGHARQVDMTMMEAERILKTFGQRMKQVHISEVNSASRHDRLSWPAVWAFQSVAGLIAESVPIIIEAPVQEDEIEDEIARSQTALAGPELRFAAAP